MYAIHWLSTSGLPRLSSKKRRKEKKERKRRTPESERASQTPSGAVFLKLRKKGNKKNVLFFFFFPSSLNMDGLKDIYRGPPVVCRTKGPRSPMRRCTRTAGNSSARLPLILTRACTSELSSRLCTFCVYNADEPPLFYPATRGKKVLRQTLLYPLPPLCKV